MGAHCHDEACSPEAVSAYNLALQSAVHSAGGRFNVSLALHLDGTFWDACWPQPCNESAWNFGGYTPWSINGSDAIIAESWAQGSLVGAVNLLLDGGVVSRSTLLLLDDTPNCDLYPSQVGAI